MKKSFPLVSAIIPTFNRAAWIRQAIDSVLEQDYPALELIVVDDGSTDETPQILASYGTKIRVIRQANRGVSAARNTGINASQGQNIAFLDSDDQWLPRKIATQVDFFKEHPQAQICQTEEIWIRKGKRVNPHKKHRKPSGMIFIPSLSLCLVSPSAVMLKRGLLHETGGFDEGLPACEDYDLWLRIAAKHAIFLIDIPLIVKNGGHADQLSKAPCLDQYRITALNKIITTGSLAPLQRQAAIDKLKEKCGIFAAGCAKRGRHQEAEAYLRMGKAFD